LSSAAVAGGLLAKTTGIRIDLDLAALLAARRRRIVAGVVGYRRLKAERPKIVEEITNLQQARLESALKAAWTQVDRLEDDVDELRVDLDRAIVVVRGLKGLLVEHGIDVPRELELHV
jgi:hypothetical protein